MRITAKEIEIATGGAIVAGAASAAAIGVSTDTRGDCEGKLFVPLVGENFDGHNFIGAARGKGASIALCSRGDFNECGGPRDGGDRAPLTVIKVADTLAALGKLAAWYRLKFNPLAVGVTGSVGKTTTKEMIALVLSKKFNVLKSTGNYNNEIGLPLTVFGLTEEHTAMVLEMGMNQPGEIGRLSKIARPDIAVITNIGYAHIEKLGTRQNILKAKLEILEGLSKNGTVFLNGDDMLLNGLMGLIDRTLVYFGLDERLDVIGTDARARGEDGLEFEFAWQARSYNVRIHSAGIHNIHNALAAIAIGLQHDVPPEQIVEALSEYRSDKLRMNIMTIGQNRLINDAYNANPQSMVAAIDVLAGLGGGGRRIALLGNMLELGDYAQEHHREVGEYAAHKGVDVLIAVGANAADIAYGAKSAKGGPNGGRGVECHIFADHGGVADCVMRLLQPGDDILVKGSRAMFMERLAEAIEAELNERLKITGGSGFAEMPPHEIN